MSMVNTDIAISHCNITGPDCENRPGQGRPFRPGPQRPDFGSGDIEFEREFISAHHMK